MWTYWTFVVLFEGQQIEAPINKVNSASWLTLQGTVIIPHPVVLLLYFLCCVPTALLSAHPKPVPAHPLNVQRAEKQPFMHKHTNLCILSKKSGPHTLYRCISYVMGVQVQILGVQHQNSKKKNKKKKIKKKKKKKKKKKNK